MGDEPVYSSAGWLTRHRRLSLDSPIIMGVVNVTPDSFSDGGRYDGTAAIEHGLELVASGADVLDIGGQSTRPGAESVSEQIELDRVVDVVGGLAAAGAVVSIDTMKPAVANRAVGAGASIINDVSGLADPAMRQVAAELGAGVVIMHMQGEPRTMQDDPTYEDVVADVSEFLADRATLAIESGIKADSIVLDPGIGFGKTTRHNLELLSRLPELVELGYPILVGASRKRFLGTLLGIDDPIDRDRATSIITALVIDRGASIVRVHDAAGSREAVSLVQAIVGSGGQA